MRIPSWLTTATGPLHRERISRGYLYVVGAALALMLLDTAVFSHRNASLTAVLLVLLTLPWTPLIWALFAAVCGMDTRGTAFGWSGWTLTVVAALVSAALNAVLLGYAARYARRRADTSGERSADGSTAAETGARPTR
ncbi:SCO4225 family membrane protein [Streptomyces sp. NPDC093221]|uniref:SCO4225 family membrane protein n=1 Tax=Streptomyces sp. NPDC093221 TaxID=3366032 RepID=UPI0037FE15CD